MFVETINHYDDAKGVHMDIALWFGAAKEFLMGWPIILYVGFISILFTVALKFIQIRYFVEAWRYMFKPPVAETKGDELTPMQAFLNALNSNLGNGSLASVAFGIAIGGPGAAIWMLIMGLLLMSVRFAEVYISTYFKAEMTDGARIGGPMIYLKHIPGGSVLPMIYAILCLGMGFGIAGAMQTNSVSVGMTQAWGIPGIAVSFGFLIFVAYVVFGGAQRIAQATNVLVPVKVGLFCFANLAVLIYHYQQILPALKLMLQAAFSPAAMTGGAVGFGIQMAMRFGMYRVIMATESGLGTASILFGATESKAPVADGILAMLSTVISTLFCFTTALCLVVSGVWQSGFESTAMVSAAFQSVFGTVIGGSVIVFLSLTFAMGVLVAYAFITREAWMFVTKGRYLTLFAIIYCVSAALGAVAKVTVVFAIADIIIAGMLIVNLYGLVCLLPIIRRGLLSFMNKQS